MYARDTHQSLESSPIFGVCGILMSKSSKCFEASYIYIFQLVHSQPLDSKSHACSVVSFFTSFFPVTIFVLSRFDVSSTGWTGIFLGHNPETMEENRCLVFFIPNHHLTLMTCFWTGAWTKAFQVWPKKSSNSNHGNSATFKGMLATPPKTTPPRNKG